MRRACLSQINLSAVRHDLSCNPGFQAGVKALRIKNLTLYQKLEIFPILGFVFQNKKILCLSK